MNRALELGLAAVPDVLALAGAGLLAYGAALVYQPAGYLVGGAFLLAIGMVGVLRRP